MSKEQQVRIQDAALAVLATSGVDGLTMRALARQMGVEAPSLYHHLPNKEALITLVIESLVERLPSAVAGQSVAQATDTFARSVADLMRDHPGLAGLLAERPERARLLAARATGLVGALVAAGMDPALAQQVALDVSWLLVGRANLASGVSVDLPPLLNAFVSASQIAAPVVEAPAPDPAPAVAVPAPAPAVAAPAPAPAVAAPASAPTVAAPAAPAPAPAAPAPAVSAPGPAPAPAPPPRPAAAPTPEPPRRGGLAGRLLRRAGHLLGGDD